MTHHRINCCKEQECAYLFIKRKILGLDPVFGSPEVKIWGQKFNGYTGPLKPGYTGPDAITGCGEELQNGIFEHSGVSLDYELWSTPELLATIPRDEISWGGSPDMEKKNFTYFISGNLIIPEKFKGLSFGSFENAEYVNGKLYYRYFGGEDDILESIQACLGVIRQDIFNVGIPYAYPGTVCDIGQQIDGITSEIVRDNILNGITSDSDPSELSSEHIFSLEVTYSNKFNDIIKLRNNRIFYSVVEPVQSVEGEITPTCFLASDEQERNAWCRGLTLIRGGGEQCRIPENVINDKKMKLAFYQTIPEAIDIFRVDLHQCNNEETGERYLSIGNVYYENSFRVQPILPRSEKTTQCATDACLPDVIALPTDNNPIICGYNRFYPDDDIYCEPINYTKKGLKWNFNCLEFPCTAEPDLDCLAWEELERQRSGFDCAKWFEEQNWILEVPVFNSSSSSSQGDCDEPCPEPNNIERINTTSFGVYNVEGLQTYWGPARDYTPSEVCGQQISNPGRCPGDPPSTQTISCLLFSFSQGRCELLQPSGSLDEVGVNILIFDGNVFFQVCIENKTTVTTIYCDGSTDEISYSSVSCVSRLGPSIGIDCDNLINNYCDEGLEPPVGVCRCCCNKNCDTEETEPTAIVTTAQDVTEYEINPYIMIDGDPLYFDAPEYTIPNFNNYAKHYFDVWKNDRIELDPTVENYEIFVDNPLCDTGFAGSPGEFFFLNKEKGLTSGILGKDYCVSIGKTLSNSIWDVVPNPDYPCKNTFTLSSNSSIRCSKVIKNKSFDSISKIYSKLPESQQPKCFKDIINYFPTEEREVNGITYISLVGITLNDCADSRSVSQVNKILKF